MSIIHERSYEKCFAPTDTQFWQRLDALVAGSRVVIDRPKGTAHPRYPDFIYPLDYGYLADTRAMDGDGVDVWVGSLPERRVTAVVCTVDVVKRDTELKLLLGCTPDEADLVLRTHNGALQAAILVLRPRMDRGPLARTPPGTTVVL